MASADNSNGNFVANYPTVSQGTSKTPVETTGIVICRLKSRKQRPLSREKVFQSHQIAGKKKKIPRFLLIKSRLKGMGKFLHLRYLAEISESNCMK